MHIYDLPQLQDKIERIIGMPTHIMKTEGTRAELGVLSPTGVELGRFRVYVNQVGRWQFGGCSSLLPEHWNQLCDL